MRVALFGGATVFTVGTLVQIIAIAWLAMLAAITAGAGAILARTGGLEPHTFRTCAVAALVLDGLLLFAVFAAWVARVMHEESRSPPPPGLFVRRPVTVIAISLLAAVVAVTAAGWERSVYFPYPLATVVVLAAGYFFALIGVVLTGRAFDRIWAPLKAWALASPYRTGALTATLVLLGAAGFALREVRWYAGPAHQLRAELELVRPPPITGYFDGELKFLCVGANEVTPGVAQSASAPACSFLTSDESADGAASAGAGDDGGDLRDACFEELLPLLPKAVGVARTEFSMSPFDAEDVASEALVETCDDPSTVRVPKSYFFRIVRTTAGRAARRARRVESCTDWQARADALAGQCRRADGPDVQAERRSIIRALASCELSDRETRILRGRLVDQLSYRAIGTLVGMTESQTKDGFHNAMARLRKRLPADCFER